jgi:hypothetical protein
MHVLNTKAKGFADPEAAVDQQGDKRPVPAALDSVRARGQEPAHGILRNRRKGLGDVHSQPTRGVRLEETGLNTPGKECPQATVMLVDGDGFEAVSQPCEVALYDER